MQNYFLKYVSKLKKKYENVDHREFVFVDQLPEAPKDDDKEFNRIISSFKKPATKRVVPLTGVYLTFIEIPASFDHVPEKYAYEAWVTRYQPALEDKENIDKFRFCCDLAKFLKVIVNNQFYAIMIRDLVNPHLIDFVRVLSLSDAPG